MKRFSSAFSALFLFSSGCAVASIDETMQEPDDIELDGNGNPTPATGGSGTVVVLPTGGTSQQNQNPDPNDVPDPATGGSNSSSSGGSQATGGNMATGGGSTGGSASTDPPPDPSGCSALGHNQDSGEFGTTDSKCFIVDYSGTMYGWRSSNAAGRTVTINGEVVGQGDVSGGPVPWPGSAPYLVEFSAGSQTNTTWAYW